MQISAKSWHYRFIDTFGSVPDTVTVCSYMRAFVFASLFMVLFGAFICCAASLFLYVIPMGIWDGNVAMYQIMVNGADADAMDSTVRAAIPMAAVLDFCVVFFLGIGAVFVVIPAIGRLFNFSFLRLIWEYIKAVKNRVCPIIEITDLEEK